MLSISLPMKGAGKGEYYLRLAQEDYYFNKGEPLGMWHGRGAERLGLVGRIDPTVMRRVLDGHSPDGKRSLVQNPGHKNRQSGWDLTFSAPKSLSVLWALAPELVRWQIELAHGAAVRTALDFLQDKAASTRCGKGGRRRESAELLFATFRHGTSREQDPQLHTHALLINLCIRKNGSTGTVWSKDFFRIKKKAGAVYFKALAEELHDRFGLQVQWEDTGFHIVGVSRELCQGFSKRSAQIKAYMTEHNESGAVAAKRAALVTRRKKSEVNRQQLFAQWRRAGERFGWGTEQAEELFRKAETMRQQRKRRQEAEVVKPIQSAQSDTPDNSELPKPTAAAQQAKAKSDETNNTQPRMQLPPGRKSQETRTRQNRTSHESEKKYQSDQKERTRRTTKYHRGRKQDDSPNDSASRSMSRSENRPYWHRGTPLFRVVWQPVFPSAPRWSPLRKWHMPRIVVGREPLPRWGKMLPRWGKIRGRKNFWLAELRLQQRRLFPKAPRWSPVRHWVLPALRIVPHPLIAKLRQQSMNEQKSYRHRSHY